MNISGVGRLARLRNCPFEVSDSCLCGETLQPETCEKVSLSTLDYLADFKAPQLRATFLRVSVAIQTFSLRVGLQSLLGIGGYAQQLTKPTESPKTGAGGDKGSPALSLAVRFCCILASRRKVSECKG